MPLGAFRLNSLARSVAVGGGPFSLGSVDFDSGDYYHTTSVTSSLTANKTITISYWIKKDAMDFRHFVITNQLLGRRHIAIINTNGSVRFYLQTDNATFDRTSSETGLITAGNWHHVVASVDMANSYFTCYVDGSAATFTNGTFTENFRYDSFDRIGINTDSITPGNDNRAAELSQIYVSNTYQDLSTLSIRQKFYDAGPVNMGNDGTLSGADTPFIFHSGSTSSTPAFTTNNGSGLSYTLTTYGTPTDGTTVA